MADTAEALFQAAVTARRNAYVPHSGLKVGAAVLTRSGAVFAGCNVENASLPEGWCAETGAIAQMIGAGEREIVAALVVADRAPPVTPCGGCRQRLAEFAGPDAQVHVADLSGIRATYALADLLPAAFEWSARG